MAVNGVSKKAESDEVQESASAVLSYSGTVDH